jgi:hypothetical protein
MEVVMLRALSCGLLLVALSAPSAAARAGEDKGKAGAKNLPLELKIVPKKATYVLDLGGRSAADFRNILKAAADSGVYPPAPAVDLVLEIKNTSGKDIAVWINGDPTRLMLDLKGPGAVNSELKGLATTLEFRVPNAIKLAPGQSHKLEIKSLSHGMRGASHRSYWVEPGEYTLTASFLTGVSPPPPGAQKADDGFGVVTLTSAPVTLKVEAK